MTCDNTRRGGFTLLELLVVILLIITLAALSAGAFYKVQADQQIKATEATVQKAQILLDARWKAVLDEARKEVSQPKMQGLITFAGGDKERATALWTYAKLRNEFPENFQEAITPITVSTYTLQPRQVFAKLATTGAAETDPFMQSAALLYASITATGTGGMEGGSEGLNQQTGTTPAGLPAFVDNWGTPIAFRRFAGPAEVQQAPYTPNNRNPLDPTGKLVSPTGDPWATTFGPLLAPTLHGGGATVFPNNNFVATLISAGPGKIFGADPYGANSADEGADNIVGYRLRQQ